jgi:hypothetical protein
MKLLKMQFKFLQIIVITRCSEILTDVFQNIQQTKIIKGETSSKSKSGNMLVLFNSLW